jgi:hypothetical protein
VADGGKAGIQRVEIEARAPSKQSLKLQLSHDSKTDIAISRANGGLRSGGANLRKSRSERKGRNRDAKQKFPPMLTRDGCGFIVCKPADTPATKRPFSAMQCATKWGPHASALIEKTNSRLSGRDAGLPVSSTARTGTQIGSFGV